MRSLSFLLNSNRSADLSGVDFDAGAHGGSQDAGLDILTLCSGGLCLDDSGKQGVEVLSQLVSTKGCLADGAVDDVGLVQTRKAFRS